MSAEHRESYFPDENRRKHTQIRLQEGLRRELNDAESILVSRNWLIVNVVKCLQADRSDELITIRQPKRCATVDLAAVRLGTIEARWTAELYWWCHD